MECMEMNFCRRCGTPLTDKTGGLFVCANDHKIFAAAFPTAGIFFVNDNNEVLLAVRGIEPNKGMLDTPGGFIEEKENAEESLEREIKEELDLSPDQYEPLRYLCSGIGTYEYQNEPRTVMSTLYWSRLKPGAVPVPQDDVADLKTIPLADINLDDIAGEDIKKGVEKLRRVILES